MGQERVRRRLLQNRRASARAIVHECLHAARADYDRCHGLKLLLKLHSDLACAVHVTLVEQLFLSAEAEQAWQYDRQNVEEGHPLVRWEPCQQSASSQIHQ
jgi:hypothetical protein